MQKYMVFFTLAWLFLCILGFDHGYGNLVVAVMIAGVIAGVVWVLVSDPKKIGYADTKQNASFLMMAWIFLCLLGFLYGYGMLAIGGVILGCTVGGILILIIDTWAMNDRDKWLFAKDTTNKNRS